MSGSCPLGLQPESQEGTNSSCSEVFETSCVLVIIKHLRRLELTILYCILAVGEEGKILSVLTTRKKR